MRSAGGLVFYFLVERTTFLQSKDNALKPRFDLIVKKFSFSFQMSNLGFLFLDEKGNIYENQIFLIQNSYKIKNPNISIRVFAVVPPVSKLKFLIRLKSINYKIFLFWVEN